MTSEERHLIGTLEAAAILKVTPRTVQRRANTDQIPVVGKLGLQGEYVFDEAKIREIAEQEQTSSED